MLHKEIPFRPKLEGIFRTRFYNAVCGANESFSLSDWERTIAREIAWVETDCSFNLQQRKKYRAVWYLLRDLLRASWKAIYREGVLLMSLPSLDKGGFTDASSPEVKALLRQWMAESRHERLLTNADFVFKAEAKGPNKRGIQVLIADGEELAGRLRAAKRHEIKLTECVKPYLQLVQENERDSFSGLKLSEIWRYFRLSWSTPYETTPGRTLQYLIRDAAHPFHAVMGIASLENCAVQITCRDDYLGWNANGFISGISGLSLVEKQNAFEQLLVYLNQGIDGIDWSGLCPQQIIQSPNDEWVKKLADIAIDAEKQRQSSLKQEASSDELSLSGRSELGRISLDTENALYTRKRADQLSKLLGAKLRFLNLLNSFTESQVEAFIKSEEGLSAIRTALVSQKAKHIGSSMMELNVCGAIPPYNEILGGKLVALLATSPQVLRDYKARYADKPSEIASRLKGSPVCRPADLVYLGTTSLYYVGSSQYNRLKIPGAVFGNNFDLSWKEIGMTMGYGTMHISKVTTAALTEATSDGFNKINHVFGEGASPKMRLLTMAVRQLLESTNDDLKDFSKHAMSRIVYGCSLAKNTNRYLLGLDSQPEYYTDISKWKEGTQRIIDFWIERWLGSRLNYEPALDRVASFKSDGFLISRELDEPVIKFEKLMEVKTMGASENPDFGLEFVRNFYGGASAYADHLPDGILEEVHLVTKLDQAIFEQIKTKDIVLTGNPGDGKTHIIRVLKKKLEGSFPDIEIEMDASTLTDDEIYSKWLGAREKGARFVLAINAAVLFAAYQKHPDFLPLKEAYEQMANCPVYHGEDVEVKTVAVFDLSKRETLTKDLLDDAISKLTDERYYSACTSCPHRSGCDALKNRILLRNPVFKERLMAILKRVALSGYHATLRQLQSFISFLIFGGKSCHELSSSAGSSNNQLANLVYSGKGSFFKAVSSAFDPVRVSHPIWDEKILGDSLNQDRWISEFEPTHERIAFDNQEQFVLMKRQFFFFNEDGQSLLDILEDDQKAFETALEYDNKKLIKELIRKLNAFFGEDHPSNSELQIWGGFRFNTEPRKVLLSMGTVKVGSLSIGRPGLSSVMNSGMDTFQNYVRLESKEIPGVFLTIDFPMWRLLSQSENGVPVLFMESSLVMKIWRFMERLRPKEEEDDDLHLVLLDIQNKNRIHVQIDRDDKKYIEIKAQKIKED